MKKVFVTRLIGLLFLLTNSSPACAQRIEYNGINYVIMGDIVYIEKVDRNIQGNIIIPSEVTYNGKTYRVTIIVADAFNGCSMLTSITLPPTLTFVSDHGFSGCNSLNAVYISDIEAFFKIGYELDDDDPLSSNPLHYAGHLFLNGEEIKDLEIPNNIMVIKDIACAGWYALNSLKIPSSVTTIGYLAFSGCSGLTSVTIPNSVISINWGAFYGCSGLKTIVSEIKKPFIIPSYTFSDDTYNNAELIVPKGTKAAYQATEGWNKFSKITEATDANTFTYNGIYYQLKSDGTLEVTGLATSTTVADIPSSIIINGTKYRVTSIGERAFEGRSDITYLSIPYSIKSIGKYAFIDCGSSMTVNIADPESWCQMELGNEHASPLSSAGKMLVHDIEATSFSVPETVTSIGAFTFYQCSCIKSLNIPGTVKSIGSSAFEDCDYLTSLTLGDGLQSIGGSAFEGCKRLTTFTIPRSVSSILVNAFKNCSSLTSVTSEIENPFAMDNSVFYGIPSDARLIVPKGTKAKYQATAGWDRFTNIIEESSVIEGDVNGDGVVNETDVNDVACYILGKTPTGFNKDAADLNSDQKVNAADIVLINNIIKKNR